jgi:glycogen debranching enzyme
MRTTIERDTCRDFSQSSKLEWLETNGTGAFAMGTVAGVNTRRYHALLVATLHPPVERRVLLSRVEEEAMLGDKNFALGAAQYPGLVSPRGFEYLTEFHSDPCATWVFTLDDVRLEKQVYLAPAKQAVILRYRSDCRLLLKIRPFLASRDYHSLQKGGGDFYQHPELKFFGADAYQEEKYWYNNNEYLQEKERGLDYWEDLWTPGYYTLELPPGVWVSFCASLEGPVEAEPPIVRDPFIVNRAGGKPTIIAGYPWFTDWGRDTMISFTGLLIPHARLVTGRHILEGFLEHMSQGVIPNRFPDVGETPEYNTVDATLWMFQAVRAWLQAGGPRGFLRDVFYWKGKEILYWHRKGTWYGIHVDPADHLLCAGVPGTQLTWMDAKVGDWVVTPRHGKAVEINALWHSALRLMAEWGRELGDADADSFEQEAFAAAESFNRQFWNAERGCLYDVIGEDGPVAKVRPNQLFAVSLRHGLLENDRERAVVRVCQEELLTPVGLRTLAPSDPEYKGRYEGSPGERDGAYHQGTVWPWLIGPFVDAYLAAFGKTPSNISYCAGLIEKLEEEASHAGCVGLIAEIYDGDEPRYPRGCPAQAWSVAEVARLKHQLVITGRSQTAG